jgi:hypothetical protein
MANTNYLKYIPGKLQVYANNVLVEELQNADDSTSGTTYLTYNDTSECTEFWVEGEKIREAS